VGIATLALPDYSIEHSHSLEVEMSIVVAVIGVVLPILIVGLFAYFIYLSDGAERERQ
jgi:hypothetical protein